MANEFRKFDELGFPIPPSYDELRYHDDEPARRPKVAIKTKRWVLATLLVLIVIPIVFGPKILDAGRGILADWLANRASQKLEEGDFNGAIEDLNEAIGWNPNGQAYYAQRAACRERLNELDHSLSDWNKAIDLLRSMKVRRKEGFQKRVNLARAYRQRGWVYVRLGRKDEALSDINQAIDTLPNIPALLHSRAYSLEIATLLNSRAYSRAILQVDLKDGLSDIDRAIELAGAHPSFLDTRGYLLHLLDRNDEALAEMTKALTSSEQDKRDFLRHQLNRLDARQFERRLQTYNEDLAVMFYHRSLIHEKLGREKEAAEDLAKANEYGYDPKKGIL